MLISKLVKLAYNVDLGELRKAHADLTKSGVMNDYNDEICAVSMALGYAVDQRDMDSVSKLIALLFAIGYKAGRDAPKESTP